MKSSHFEKVMKMEIDGVLGFITKQTQTQILEYIKQLEWNVDELEGMWLKDESIH